jgi:putative CocE/NonD family hydrolase
LRARRKNSKIGNFVDPEKWVPDGYAVVRVDGRGAGRSPGKLDVWSPREIKDFYDCIEWAATQPWNNGNGNVGINGISYYAMNQWLVAALQPPHLTAMCVWEGAADHYRDLSRHGGILCQFDDPWFRGQVANVQHGKGESGGKGWNGELIAGPETLSPVILEQNRATPYPIERDQPLDGPYYRDRLPDFSKITVPFLSAANWGGMGCHPRGNFEGYLAAASSQKWLETHGNTHFAPFYRTAGEQLQKRFFGHFSSLPSNSMCVTLAKNSLRAASKSGRWRARSGRGTISIRKAANSRTFPRWQTRSSTRQRVTG